MADDYHSPFQLPDTTCTNPDAAEDYPLSHAKANGDYLFGPPCPVHGNGRSANISWIAWADAREAYATYQAAGNDEADERRRRRLLDDMLQHVTASIPPHAPASATPRRVTAVTTTGHSARITQYALILAFTCALIIMLDIAFG